jgi:acyl dehydratase
MDPSSAVAPAVMPPPGQAGGDPHDIDDRLTNADMLNPGDRAGPYDLVIDAESAAAFGAATLDPNPRYFAGTALPPTAIATQAYRAQFAAMFQLVPESVFAEARGGVHGRHELFLHRPIVPDEALQTVVETHSARSSGENLRITLLHKTYDADEQLVAEQWWTTVMLGTTADPMGPALPDHAVVDLDGRRPIAEEVVRVDLDMARRYGQVSGDFSEHHFDVEAARRSGYEGPFLHGLCTMALCARAAVRTVCGEDPTRLQRLAVRFASPAFFDRDLAVRIYALGGDRYALEALCGEDTVVRNGLAELRASTAL